MVWETCSLGMVRARCRPHGREASFSVPCGVAWSGFSSIFTVPTCFLLKLIPESTSKETPPNATAPKGPRMQASAALCGHFGTRPWVWIFGLGRPGSLLGQYVYLAIIPLAPMREATPGLMKRAC